METMRHHGTRLVPTRRRPRIRSDEILAPGLPRRHRLVDAKSDEVESASSAEQVGPRKGGGGVEDVASEAFDQCAFGFGAGAVRPVPFEVFWPGEDVEDDGVGVLEYHALDNVSIEHF